MYLKVTKVHYYILQRFQRRSKFLNGIVCKVTDKSSTYYYDTKYHSYLYRVKRQHRLTTRVYLPIGLELRVKRTRIKRISPQAGELKWMTQQL